MFRSKLYNKSNRYPVVKGKMKVEDNIRNNGEYKKLTFKKNAPFKSGISKIR